MFFTDGVPTFDRLVHKSTPGILPAEPPAPERTVGRHRPARSYSQVAFRRADYISNQFRRSVRMIGVGVGVQASPSRRTGSTIPGAGYRTQWERGSYSYVRDTIGYEARYQTEELVPTARGTGSTSSATYARRQPTTGAGPRLDRRHRSGVRVVREPGQHQQQRRRAHRRHQQHAVSTAEYQANNSNPLYRAVTKTYNNGPDWEIWTGSRSSGNSNEYRSTKIYNSPPYEAYDPPVTASTRNDVILARLIAGNDNGTPATWDGSTYTNAEIADMYVLPQWSQFGKAMEAVALGECGGTLTLQTKINGTTPAPDPFRYQNSAVDRFGGQPGRARADRRHDQPAVHDRHVRLRRPERPVRHRRRPAAELLRAERPTRPGAWCCRAGNQPRSVTPIDIPDGGAWKGVRVRVAANEAVSCTLSVTR